MYYETSKNDHGLKYNPFKAIVSPRPIAWIASCNADGSHNLAPYSFFNAMSDAPAMIGFSSGPMKAGLDEPKDSLTNILREGEFTISVVSYELRNQMNATSAHLPNGVDEFEIAGLEKAPSKMIKAPFVAQAPVALECKLWNVVDLPAPGEAKWVMGQVVGVHIKDEFIEDGRLDVSKYRPISRLGYGDYAVIDEVFELERP